MIFSVEIPDSFAKGLRLDGPRPDQRTLEVFALEGYRSGELSRGKVGELLGFGFYETEEFLKKNGAEIKLTLEEFEHSATILERLIGK
jgi:predicted HTH domain antitoxin